MPLIISASWTLLYFITLDLSWRLIDAQTYDNMTALKKNLLTEYDKDIIPVINQSHVLNVEVMFSLINIPEVDTINSFIKLRAFLYLSWTDEKLTWVPSHYGNIREVSLPANTVWTPPITLGGGVPIENIVNSWQKVYINHLGFTQVIAGGAFTSICGFTMIYWPFDKQACNLYFIPGTKNVKFAFTPNPIHESNFIQMGEWTYDQMTASYLDRFDNLGKDIIYTIKIHRQSAFYVLTFILPMYCVSFLGLLVLLIPCDSGERVGFAITIMLSMVVFLTVTKDEVPKSSAPHMCILINTLVCVAFVGNIINLVSLRLFYNNEAQPVGQKYQYLVNIISRFNERTVQPEDTKRNNIDINPTSSPSKPEKNLDHRLLSIRKEHQGPAEEDFISKQKVKEERIVTWKDVSQAIDRITFVTAAPVATLATITGTVYLKVASDYPDWSN